MDKNENIEANPIATDDIQISHEPTFPRITTYIPLDDAKKAKAITDLIGAFIQVQHNIEQPKKDKEGYGYKYAPLDKVMAAIDKARKDLDVCIVQIPVSQDNLTGIRNQIMNSEGAMIDFGSYMLEAGSKAQDRGSALTYARRYSISAIFGIASEEDDDGKNASKNVQQNYISQLEKMTVRLNKRPIKFLEVYMLAASGDKSAQDFITKNKTTPKIAVALKNIAEIRKLSKYFKLPDKKESKPAKNKPETKAKQAEPVKEQEKDDKYKEKNSLTDDPIFSKVMEEADVGEAPDELFS